ncbi:hypothetical protein KP509_10G069300 [Ceratopteris richardii]|uniref:GTD-binding domain-containing protein n=1 Tax=Ceratopteris richardii TaxID=49495 RepID=A0A8T2U029_CERRI|nr:hypothetical protein KP509_10G069300 [Ceratopteris richardii]
MDSRNPWRIPALISVSCEVLFSLFLLFQMLMTLTIVEAAKFLQRGATHPCDEDDNHTSRCSSYFPPFSSCPERDSGVPQLKSGDELIRTRFPRGSTVRRILSEGHSKSKEGNLVDSVRKAGSIKQARSLLLLSDDNKQRIDDTAIIEASTSEGKSYVKEDEFGLIDAGLSIHDDLIDIRSEYLEQKGRGPREVIMTLLKALQDQGKSLKTLYEELDEERNAAETAANEAMAMILRLQEEKAALQIKADHYQRMAEEKSLHDEHAIQLLEEDLFKMENERILLEEELNELQIRLSLEEDLCRKKNERILLVEELNELRSSLVQVDIDNVDRMGLLKEEAQHHSTTSKPDISLSTIDGDSRKQEHDSEELPGSLEIEDAALISSSGEVLREHFREGLLNEDLSRKLFKSLTHYEMHDFNEFQISDVNGDTFFVKESNHAEQAIVGEDAKSILVQLSAVEEQLLALEGSDKSEQLHQAQESQTSLLHNFSNPNDCAIEKLGSDDEEVNSSQIYKNDIWITETEESSMFVEEKVVPLDDITRRLQALESENMFQQHHLFPSTPECVNIIKLKEIVQELQKLLKTNKDASTTANKI